MPPETGAAAIPFPMSFHFRSVFGITTEVLSAARIDVGETVNAAAEINKAAQLWNVIHALLAS